LQAMVNTVQSALPGIFALTNQIAAVLDQAAGATSNLNATLAEARPLLTNFAIVSAQLREPGGPLIWALGTNGSEQLQSSLTNANRLLGHTDTNLAPLLISLANITSNLNVQVQANSNLLSGIAQTVADADSFVQGLKRHWFLRSAFKTKATNAPPAKTKGK
jgi:ABC-type transporter Mla subunit MlaD